MISLVAFLLGGCVADPGPIEQPSPTTSETAEPPAPAPELPPPPPARAPSGPVATGSVEAGNAAPTGSAVLGPADAMRLIDDLRCSFVGGDPDGDRVTVVVSWTVDGTPWSGATASDGIPGDSVPSGALVAGQVWTCATRVDDQAGGSLVATSAPVTITEFEVARVDPWVDPVFWIEPVNATPGASVVLRYAGPLADRGAVDARVGFEGWDDVAWDEPPRTFETFAGPFVYGWEFAMTAEADGTWSLPIVLPKDARAVHFVAVAEGEVDDASGLEYHWDPSFPYVGPFLTWNDEVDPRTGIVVTFESSIPGRGVVVYAGPDGVLHTAVGTEIDTLHHVPLRDLVPGSDYTGYVTDATNRAAPFSFRTFSEDETAFSVIAMADMQDSGGEEDAWPRIAAEALRTVPDARAVLAPGDLAADDEPGYWWRFFAGAGELFTTVPLVPTIGNHDTPGRESNPDDTSFRRWFDLPDDEVRFALDLGSLRVIAISSEDFDQMQLGSDQADWLESTLDATLAEARPWVFVGFHHPPYDIGQRFNDQTDVYRGITELFDGRVDWVLTGHEHLYQRTAPIQFEGSLATSGAYGVGPDDGTGYLVMPTAGDFMFDQVMPNSGATADDWDVIAFPPPPAGVYYPEEHGFVQIDLDGREIWIRTYGLGTIEAPLDPWVRDEIRYTKP